MCLVLAMTNTKKLNLSKCLNDIGNTLLAAEDDGFGYAIQGKNGVFGEKTIAKRFFTRLSRLNHVQLPIVKKKYMGFGSPSELTGPGIFHGRTSTNVISLIDTHPMQIDNWNLIHNGVVDDLGPFYEKKTENDSEDVLRRLIDGVGNPNPMADIEKYLQGYYAFAAIDPEGRLHVARDQYAPLCIAWSGVYETFIIATNPGLILKVNKILDAKIGPIDEIQDETYCIFNGNELIHCQDFDSLGYTMRQSQHATASLGRVLGDAQLVCGLANAPTNVLRDVSPNPQSKERSYAEVSEADWQDSIVDYLKTERHPDRRGGVTEDDYYKYKHEIENMDASYQIFSDDKPISLLEFRKLDHVAQEMCTILRGDGSVVEPENYAIPRLRGGRHSTK